MRDTVLNSQKFFLFPKMAAILNFDKNGNSAISAKFFAHTVYKQDCLLNSQKFFLFPKIVAILNFRIFDKW